MTSIIHQNGIDIAASIASGASSCEEVARACLQRIAAREPIVHAWAYIDEESVLAAARRLGRSEKRGLLHGVPIGIKDIIDTGDMPTQMGSPIYAGYRPATDAACVALLRAAGALILGKTVTAEFAGREPGPTTNPHDPTRTPGGSSSGSGAAVADFMVPIALGTQTGGSVQRPASYCGVVGFKPTRAFINRAGVKPAAESLDTVGILARSLDDVALTFAVLTNGAPQQLEPIAVRRAAVCRTPLWSRAQPETVEAIETAAEALSRAGVAVGSVELPKRFADLMEARKIVDAYQRAHTMAWEWREHRALLSESLQEIIRTGLATPPERLAFALETIDACRVALPAAAGNADVLITPCVDGEAPVGIGWTGAPEFQALWTMLDVPTVGIPTHLGPHGMPVSIQLAGAAYGDVELLARSKWVAQHLPSPTLVRST